MMKSKWITNPNNINIYVSDCKSDTTLRDKNIHHDGWVNTCYNKLFLLIKKKNVEYSHWLTNMKTLAMVNVCCNMNKQHKLFKTAYSTIIRKSMNWYVGASCRIMFICCKHTAENKCIHLYGVFKGNVGFNDLWQACKFEI